MYINLVYKKIYISEFNLKSKLWLNQTLICDKSQNVTKLNHSNYYRQIIIVWRQKNTVENLIFKTKPYLIVETGSGRDLGSKNFPEIFLTAKSSLRQTGCADAPKKLKRRVI